MEKNLAGTIKATMTLTFGKMLKIIFIFHLICSKQYKVSFKAN